MIRFMGFVTGAAVAIGLMLYLFGLPELPAEPEAGAPQEPVAAETGPAAAAGEREVPEAPPPEPPTAAQPKPETTAPEVADAAPTAVAPVEDAPREFDIAVGDEPLAADLRWHAFWSPFRSQIAADGFISRLEAVTGFDYRVVKVDNGVYEVAFAYASDDERLNKLEAIETATGLEMPDS